MPTFFRKKRLWADDHDKGAVGRRGLIQAMANRGTASAGLGGFIAALAGNAGVRAAGAAIGIVATFVATSRLGAYGAGVVYGTIAWVLGASILTRWGGVERLLIEVPKHANGRRSVAIPALVNQELVSGIGRSLAIAALFALAIAVLDRVTRAPPISLLLLALYLPLNTVLQLQSATLKGLGMAAAAIALEFAVPPGIVIAVALGGALVGLPMSVTIVGGAYIGGTVVAIGLSMILLTRLQWHSRAARRPTAETRRRKRNFTLVELIGFFNGWVTLLLLPLLTSADDVGRFNIILRIAGAVVLIGTTLFAVILPRLSAARSASDAAEWHRVVAFTRAAMAAMGLAFAGAVLLLGRYLIGFAGADFAPALGPLHVLAGCYGLAVAMGPSDTVLFAAGREQTVRNLTLATTGCSMLALPPAVLTYGLFGAAWVTGLGYLATRGALLWAERAYVGPAGTPRLAKHSR